MQMLEEIKKRGQSSQEMKQMEQGIQMEVLSLSQDLNARLKAGEQDGDGSDGEPARRGPGRPRKNPENLAV